MKDGKRFWWLLFVIAILINIKPVFATGGGLRKNSIKTCPDGVTYGKHSDGNGGMHWHRAATNGSNYYAVGEAIYDDPCPGYSGNQGTAESTQGGSSSSNSSNNNGNSSSSSGSTNSSSNDSSNNSSNNSSNSSVTNNTPVVPKKSSDTSIEYIIINDEKITSISDEMNCEINKKNVSIEVITKSNKATFKINGNTKDLSSDSINKIELIVTAEDETTKTYVLNITRKIVESSVEIEEFKVNDSIIEFEEKKGNISVSNSIEEFTYSYILSDESATLKILSKDGEEFTEEKIKLNQGYNYYDLLITDSDGNTSTYELEVERISNNENTNTYERTSSDSGGSFLTALLLLLIVIGLTIVPPVGIGLLIFFAVTKKNKK